VAPMNLSKINIMSELSILDKVIYGLLTRKNSQGSLTPRKGAITKKLLNFYTGKKFERLKKSSPKFNFNNVEKYFEDFLLEHASTNAPFVININKGILTDLQIVHSSLIEDESGGNRKSFGFTIHLPFDNDEQGNLEFEIFSQSSYKELFQEDINSEITTYFYDTGSDVKKLVEMIKKVLSSIRNYKQTDSFILTHWFV
jgi:hypothetical protein